MLSFIYSFFQSRCKYYYLSLIYSDNKWHIHGLWPQTDSEHYPTFCKNLNFNVETLDPIMTKLDKYWYSDENKNEAFWKHEYLKHGSCVDPQLTELEYFEKTLGLYNKALSLNLQNKYKKDDKAMIPVDLNFNFIDNLEH